MADQKRPPRRPVVGSRNPTGRPRGVAGRRPAPEPPAEAPEVDAAATAWAPPDEAEESAPARGRPARAGGALVGRRTTGSLLVALVLLLAVAAGEGWYLWFKDDPVVSAARPVVIGEVAHRSAVEAARQSTEEILSYGYQDFDQQVADATGRMTPAFAERFRATADDVRQRFVRQRTEQDVRVVAASVVQASAEEVRALLFLDQYVVRRGEGTAVTPYRALVTVVRGEGGWLVSDIETK